MPLADAFGRAQQFPLPLKAAFFAAFLFFKINKIAERWFPRRFQRNAFGRAQQFPH